MGDGRWAIALALAVAVAVAGLRSGLKHQVSALDYRVKSQACCTGHLVSDTGSPLENADLVVLTAGPAASLLNRWCDAHSFPRTRCTA